jgi:hypothetical protein
MNSADETADVPVLTQVVDELPAAGLDSAALEALGRQLEQALVQRLAPELQRLTTQAVREAVAAALAQALGEPKRD